MSGVYAFRGETAVAFESTLERDFIIRSEFSLSVADIIPQPVEVPFVDRNGRSFTYTPDFLVYFKLCGRHYENYPKPLLVEVKPETEWRKSWRKWLPKWKAAKSLAKEQGWQFHIHDESRIRDQTLLNIRFLERYKRASFDPAVSALIINAVNDMTTVPMHYLLARFYMGEDRGIGITHIWHLLATRQLDCDISSTLGQSTELWIARHE